MKLLREPLRQRSLVEIKAAYREPLRNDDHERDSVSKGAGLGFLFICLSLGVLPLKAVSPIEAMTFYEAYVSRS